MYQFPNGAPNAIFPQMAEPDATDLQARLTAALVGQYVIVRALGQGKLRHPTISFEAVSIDPVVSSIAFIVRIE